MSYPCVKCGQPANDVKALCQRCSSQQSMQKVMIVAVMVAILAIGAIVVVLLQTTSSSTVVEPITPPPTISTVAINTPTPNSTSTPPTQTSAIKPSVLENYKNTVQPIISDVRAEMSATILDLKEFLKMVNSTKDTKAVRQIIDSFREQMKKHSDKFISLNRSLRSIAPPMQLEDKHERLSVGIGKYNGSVQGYITGLAAYNFQQIRASQTQLEQADKEILTAMVELQESFSSSIPE